MAFTAIAPRANPPRGRKGALMLKHASALSLGLDLYSLNFEAVVHLIKQMGPDHGRHIAVNTHRAGE
jgi:hypothetical protein